ncbi:hypothetical protein M8C13_07445 [Crossiella sp. SN42]|uniref:hypothetical protein n=1 Tax=Crossiella sp. SN42 TaxID=2944808 RepID=UPI00207CE3FA|nr:hypothetical protein [Crossiella sp. SN42]MCO1575591.1 hypothetical protein [Crossiella sp. SN42]
MTDEIVDREVEHDVAWRMTVELFNRPTWPTAMWSGSPADAARQLFEFGDVIVDLVKPVRDRAPLVLEHAIQLVRSAVVCASLLDEHDIERISSADRAGALCDSLAPFVAVATRVLNDLADQFGFRTVLMPSPAQRRNLSLGHEGFDHHALKDGIQALVYWSDDKRQSHQTTV